MHFPLAQLNSEIRQTLRLSRRLVSPEIKSEEEKNTPRLLKLNY